MLTSLQHEAHRISNKLITTRAAAAARLLTSVEIKHYALGGIGPQRPQEGVLLLASFN